jgi:uncharacterized protein (TIGR02246 family)
MKKPLFRFSIFNLTLLLFLTLTVGCWGQVESGEQAKSLTNEELLANQELDQRFIESMSQMDIEKLMSCFWNSPDLIFVDFDGNVNRGSDNIRKVFEQFFTQFESLSLECDEISHIRAGNSVFAVGTATYFMQMKDSTSQQVTQRWSDVRGKVDGHWVYVLDHVHFLSSSNP